MEQELRRVRGFPDLSYEDVLKHDFIIKKALQISKCFNFQKIDLPILEYTNIFSRTLGSDSDIVNKEMYTFQKNEESLTLRPEGTASVARRFITEKLKTKLPLRWVYHGPMFRHERPQKGRFRQFQTVAAEILGENQEEVDSELISFAYLFLKELELDKKVYLEINTIGSLENRVTYKKNLKDYLKKFYKDLSPDSKIRFDKNPLRIWDSKDKQDQNIMKEAPLLQNFLDEKSLKSYDIIKKQLQSMQIPFRENLRLVRGLDYYNNLVFEFKSKDLGAQSAVLAGGRYDHLIQTLDGPSTPAIGWGAGIERLALLSSYSPQGYLPEIGLIALGEKASSSLLPIAFQLRGKGYKVFYKFSGNLSKQMSRIDKKQCTLALIIGKKELMDKKIIFKNMNKKEQKTLPTVNFNTLLEEIKSSLNKVSD